MQAPLWRPSPDRVSASQLEGFRLAAGVEGDHTDLHRWSVEDPAGFWSLAWDRFGVVGEPGEEALKPGSDHMADTTFFPGARLNVARNMLRLAGPDPAIVFEGEDGSGRELSWDGLHHLVSRLQQGLVDAGVDPGDRVAAWLPNVPEAVAAMLAAASIGAVFTSTSPDFGTDGVLDRFGQVEPTVLFATDGYWYGGRRHELLNRLAEVCAALPSVRRTVVVPSDPEGWCGSMPAGAVSLDDFLSPYAAQPVAFADLAFDHPLYVLYSSGTTGAPKCIVHRAGGILLKHLVEHRLMCDLRPGDRAFYFTTTGWMMWNWLVSGLASEATLVLYDGSPFHPDGSRLFDLAEGRGVSLFGVSARFVDSVAKAGLRPADTHDLSRIRTICSTGSPLSPEGFESVYRDWKPDVHLASISGGTDLCGCLVGGIPTAPVYAGQIQGPGLGMAIDVFDEGGSTAPAGERGELVCTSAFPSMPIGFWDDPDDRRYHAAYFGRYRGAWHQGDFAEWTEEGGLVIHGRSDATLNPGGVRIGTSEIYRRVEQLDEVLEGLVIGQEWGPDTRIVLFVVTAEGVDLDDGLVERIRNAVRTGASPRHVPAVVLRVPELPRTRSGKLVEMAVRDVVEGRPVSNVEALANPEALEHFRDLPELAS